MDWIRILELVGSFLLGGGLTTLLTIRVVRHNIVRESKIGDLEAMQKVIDGLSHQLVEVQQRSNERAEVWHSMCLKCSYREFYFEQERRLNEKITARANVDKENHRGRSDDGRNGLDAAIERLQPGPALYPLG